MSNVKMTSARKKINKLNDKYRHGYWYKVWTFRICLIALLSFGVFSLINNFSKDNSTFDENNIANLNSNKFKSNIVSLYERDGEDSKFYSTMEKLESDIAVYLIENTTPTNNSFEKLVKNVEKELNSDDWSLLNLDKNLYYSGEYILNDKGNLTFKFNKDVEPTWAKSLDKFIVLN